MKTAYRVDVITGTNKRNRREVVNRDGFTVFSEAQRWLDSVARENPQALVVVTAYASPESLY
jgi:hypothetical protein